jgi:hypothetical protein
MTIIDLITDALLEIGVINETETPSAEQGQHALRKLNQILETWEETKSIKLGWSEQTDISATAPLPPYAERGVTLKLAMALAPSYGGAASVSPALIAEFTEEFANIGRKAALKVVTERDTRNMPAGEGDLTRGVFNILTG